MGFEPFPGPDVPLESVAYRGRIRFDIIKGTHLTRKHLLVFLTTAQIESPAIVGRYSHRTIPATTGSCQVLHLPPTIGSYLRRFLPLSHQFVNSQIHGNAINLGS